jgi:hypothetical protein
MIDRSFERLAEMEHGAKTLAVASVALVCAFILGLVLVELRRAGLVPEPWATHIPTSHFFAINVAFSLLLVFELVSLVISLAESVSNSVGKQLEIFSLILLRNSFKEFIHFDEPVTWATAGDSVLVVLANAAGALAIFVGLRFYYGMQRHRPITARDEERDHFITAKRLVAIGLLLAFAAVGVLAVVRFVAWGQPSHFFGSCYTILIFADILIVLLSLRYSATYQVVFRNSAFALATVVIRLALTAPGYYDAAMGVAAMLLIIGLTAAYNAFRPLPSHG